MVEPGAEERKLTGETIISIARLDATIATVISYLLEIEQLRKGGHKEHTDTQRKVMKFAGKQVLEILTTFIGRWYRQGHIKIS